MRRQNYFRWLSGRCACRCRCWDWMRRATKGFIRCDYFRGPGTPLLPAYDVDVVVVVGNIPGHNKGEQRREITQTVSYLLLRFLIRIVATEFLEMRASSSRPIESIPLCLSQTGCATIFVGETFCLLVPRVYE